MRAIKDDRNANRVTHGPHRPDPHPPTVRKVPADSVSYGESISLNGKTVWAAYDDAGRLIAVAATADEARHQYKALTRKGRGDGSNLQSYS